MSDSSANGPAGRDVPAETSPVPAGAATLPMGATPYEEPNCLVLRSPLGSRPSCLIVILLMPAVFLLVSLLRDTWAERAAGTFAVVAITAFLLWFWYSQAILPCVTFDREAGLLTLGWRGRRGQRPLASVVGVQVMQTLKQFGGPELNIAAQKMYQMNLILDDPAERRLNVLTCDAWTARSHAQRIADFLGVPILDSIGPTADADGSAKPARLPPEDWKVPAPVVTELGPDVLLIRPHHFALLAGVHWMSLVWIAILTGVLLSQAAGNGWLPFVGTLAFSIIFPVLGMLQTLGRRARFDRVRGVLILGLRRRPPRPLASLKAVEIVSDAEPQLNLLPIDPTERRINLLTSADAALVCRIGERLASFLSVPLVDARRQTATVNPLDALSRSPLPAGKASIRGAARVVLKGDDVLILQRSRRIWLQLVSPLLTVGGGLYLAWLVLFGPGGLGPAKWGLTIVLLGSLMQLAALKPLILYRNRFDRQTGLLTLGCASRKGWCVPQESVLPG